MIKFCCRSNTSNSFPHRLQTFLSGTFFHLACVSNSCLINSFNSFSVSVWVLTIRVSPLHRFGQAVHSHLFKLLVSFIRNGQERLKQSYITCLSFNSILSNLKHFSVGRQSEISLLLSVALTVDDIPLFDWVFII